ncbi:unnamed protein product, partial [marine sediment metagenome]
MSKVIWVVGTPSGGTSAAAGILHHLGVDMGEPMPTMRPYLTFEDRNGRRFDRPTGEDEAVALVAGPKGGRRFRDYLEWRLEQANGRLCGVKLGASYWMGDPDPATLPVRILKVNRPWESSVNSDAGYQLMKKFPRSVDEVVARATQMGGYWMAKELI